VYDENWVMDESFKNKRLKPSPFMLTKRKGGLEMEASKLVLLDYKKLPPSRLV
jgi:hypothetical protein